MYDKARKILNEMLQTAPTFGYLHYYLGVIYLNEGKFQEALQEFQTEDKLQKGQSLRVEAWTGIAYFKLGRPEKTREILDRMLERRQRGYVSPTLLSVLHFTLGQNDEGFRMLDEALAEHDSDIRLVPIDPAFDPVRSDPRLAAVIKKAGYGQ
jgi:tetratricopeptide (TPR) repeat protein